MAARAHQAIARHAGLAPGRRFELAMQRPRDGRVLVASLLLALAGCGGGAELGVSSPSARGVPMSVMAATAGRDVDRDAPVRDLAAGRASHAPAAPTLALRVDGRRLRFSWTAAGTATHYKLFANHDGASGFTQAGIPLAADSTGMALGMAAHYDRDRARYLLEACNDAGCTASNPVRPPAAPPQAAVPARFNEPTRTTASAGTAAGRACIRCPIRP